MVFVSIGIFNYVIYFINKVGFDIKGFFVVD